MKIGIAGYGKMGKDIFQTMFDATEAEFVVLTRSHAEEHAAAFVKTLDKQLRRKRLTEAQYAAKRAAVQFTEDTAALADCGAVLETITENLAAKQELFRNLAEIVSRDCLLLTNTSSLPVEEIFAGMEAPERCLGMHFFYPVKLSEYAELNLLPESAPETVKTAGQLLSGCGKQSICFTGAYHVYLNQLLSGMISLALFLREHYRTSVPALSKALEELFPGAGLFDMLDGVGLGLIAENQTHFRLERNLPLLQYGADVMRGWLAAGCSLEPRQFYAFLEAHGDHPDAPCEDVALLTAAYLLNEVSCAMSESGTQEILPDAVRSTLGIGDDLRTLFRRYGADRLSAALETLRSAADFPIFWKTAAWDNYFLTEQNL